MILQANPDYKGVCHVALAQEGHCRPGEVLLSLSLSHDVESLEKSKFGVLVSTFILDPNFRSC